VMRPYRRLFVCPRCQEEGIITALIRMADKAIWTVKQD
jgi:hypothetical protein